MRRSTVHVNKMQDDLVKRAKEQAHKREPLQLLKISFPLTVFCFVACIAYISAFGDFTLIKEDTKHQSCLRELSYRTAFGFCTLYAFICFGLIGYHARGVRGRFDGFGIADELKSTLVGVLVAFIFIIVFTLGADVFKTNDYGLNTLCCELLVFYVAFFSLIKPAYQTANFTLPAWSDTPHPDDVKTLEDTLAIWEGREAFRLYLEAEGAKQPIYNFNFWEQMMHFQEVYAEAMKEILDEDEKQEFFASAREQVLGINDYYLQFDSIERVEIADEKVYNAYNDLYKRCRDDVRLADGGAIKMEELGLVFEPLIEYVFQNKLQKTQWKWFSQSTHFTTLKHNLQINHDTQQFLLALDFDTFLHQKSEESKETGRSMSGIKHTSIDVSIRVRGSTTYFTDIFLEANSIPATDIDDTPSHFESEQSALTPPAGMMETETVFVANMHDFSADESVEPDDNSQVEI